MIGHDRFSALRLRHLFPANILESARFYSAVPDEGARSFEESYMGGSWCSDEVIDGVTLWFPRRAKSQVGILQISGGPYPDASAVRGYPEPFTGPFLDPQWTANANVALSALDLALRIGDHAEAVRGLARGHVHEGRSPRDAARNWVSFVCALSDLYHMQAIVHDLEGLLYLEIRLPDLIRANEHEKGTYDSCTGGLFRDQAESRADPA